MAANMSQVRVYETALEVHAWGAPDGEPFLFLHALGAVTSGGFFGEVAVPLAARGYRVAAPDAPGFGRSPLLPPERYAPAELVRLYLGLADELGFERFALAGHSWGGSVACHLAAAAPDRVEALVLLDSGHADYGDRPDSNAGATFEERLEEARARELRVESREALDALLAEDAVRFTPELAVAVLAGMRVEPDGSLVGAALPEARAAAVQALARARQSEQWPAIRAAAIPVLLLLATEPPEARELSEPDVERFSAALPDATVRWLVGCGHDLVADAGPALAETIGDWLDLR